jgi:hypothetical protein
MTLKWPWRPSTDYDNVRRGTPYQEDKVGLLMVRLMSDMDAVEKDYKFLKEAVMDLYERNASLVKSNLKLEEEISARKDN